MPDASKWVDWWQKEREIKAIEGIRGNGERPMSGNSGGGSAGAGPGCGAMLLLFLILGGCGVLLQKGGCIVTEESLRASAQITTVQTVYQPEKELVWVHFAVQNGSKCPISLNVRVELSKTTDPTILFHNSIKLLTIPAFGEAKERVPFEASRLKEQGLPDISDTDRCRISYKIEWITEAGSEPK